ncbi:hypothetical protein [Burkholderia contaminans]|uniref:hypothetical protein n=1 Tax=Burkholderia contaminans TaxID=488447 RepID=UPI00158D5E6D|nr:hypothetical protein [Burkholderia contaminans]
MGIREKFALWRMEDKSWSNQEYFDLRMKDNPEKTLDEYYRFAFDELYAIDEPLGNEEFLTYVKACGYREQAIDRILKHAFVTTIDWIELARVNPYVLETNEFAIACRDGFHRIDFLPMLFENPKLVEYVPFSLQNVYNIITNEEQDPQLIEWGNQCLEWLTLNQWIGLADKDPRVLDNRVFVDKCYTNWSTISGELNDRPNLVKHLPEEIRKSYLLSREEKYTEDGKLDITNKLLPLHIRNKYGDIRIIKEVDYDIDHDTGEAEVYSRLHFYAKNKDGYYKFIHSDYQMGDFFYDGDIIENSNSDISTNIAANSKVREYFASEDFANEYTKFYNKEQLENCLEEEFFEDRAICLNLITTGGNTFLDKMSDKLLADKDFIYEALNRANESKNFIHNRDTFKILSYAKCDFEHSEIIDIHRMCPVIGSSLLSVLSEKGMLTEEFMFKVLTEFPEVERACQVFMLGDNMEEKYPFLRKQDFYTRVFDTNPKIVTYLVEDQEFCKTLYERNKDSYLHILEGVGHYSSHFSLEIGYDHILSMLNEGKSNKEISEVCSKFFRHSGGHPAVEEAVEKLLSNPQFNEFLKTIEDKEDFYLDCRSGFDSLDAFFHITENCGFEIDRTRMGGMASDLFGYEEGVPEELGEDNLAIFKKFYHELKRNNSSFKDLPEMKDAELIDYAKSFLNSTDLKDKLSQDLDTAPSKADKLVASINEDAEYKPASRKSTRQKI